MRYVRTDGRRDSPLNPLNDPQAQAGPSSRYSPHAKSSRLSEITFKQRPFLSLT